MVKEYKEKEQKISLRLKDTKLVWVNPISTLKINKEILLDQ